METSNAVVAGIGLLSLFFLARRYLNQREFGRKLAAIPSIENTGIFSFVTNRTRFISNCRDMVQEGYDQYKGSLFRIPAMNQWVVLITNPKLLEDFRKAPDDVFSLQEALKDILEIEYTLGKPLFHDPYQVDTVRGPLTRNIAARFFDVQDEIKTSFQELLPATEEWVPVTLNDTIMQVVARTSNRFLSGLPLCRDPDYIDLNIKFTIQVVLSGQFIGLFPEFLKSVVGNLFTPLPRSIRRAKEHLEPIIKDRLAKEEEYGEDWPERPNDLLSWLLPDAIGPRRSIDDLVMRVLTINFGAIHTTTMTTTTAMTCLALYPQYIQILREEIETVVAEHGWTKMAMGQMRKLDSFLMEAQRFADNGVYGAQRKVMKDFTFSNGVTVPAGVSVAIPIWAIHHDDTYFPDASQFDGLRFYNLREQEGESIKHQMVTPTFDFLLFGHGRHACPGRFFAVNELKALMAYILLTYDFKLENEGVWPKVQWFGTGGSRDGKTRYLFRKRAT